MAGFFSQRSEETEGGDYFVRPRPGQDCRNGKIKPSMTHSFKTNYRNAIILGAIFVAVFIYASPARAILFVYADDTNLPAVGNLENAPPGTRGCSGTLIAPQLVLTAGHCFNAYSPIPGVTYQTDQIIFRFVPRSSSAAVSFRSYGFQYFGNENSTSYGYEDLAVVMLASPVPSSYATPIPLASREPLIGTSVSEFGMGEGCPGCRNYRQRSVTFSFAGLPSYVGGFACDGDSGGMWYNNARGELFGVISRGSCSSSGYDLAALPYHSSHIFDKIRSLIAQWGGVVSCTAGINPTEGQGTTQFTATLYTLGGTNCSYFVNGQYFGQISCGNPSSLSFTGSQISPPNAGRTMNSSYFKVLNGTAIGYCTTPGFIIGGDPASPAIQQITSSNPNPKGEGIKGAYRIRDRRHRALYH